MAQLLKRLRIEPSAIPTQLATLRVWVRYLSWKATNGRLPHRIENGFPPLSPRLPVADAVLRFSLRQQRMRGLPQRFHARVNPTPVAAPRLVKLNEALAQGTGFRCRRAPERAGSRHSWPAIA